MPQDGPIRLFEIFWRSGTLILASDVCQGYTGQLATYERGINEINSYLGAKPFEQAKGLPGLPKMARIHTISDLVDLSSCKLNYFLRPISSFLALWMIKTNA